VTSSPFTAPAHHGPPPGAALAHHLRDQLFWYALAVIGGGWLLGILGATQARAWAPVLAPMMMFFVFLMIFPMMIGLNLALLPQVFKQPRPLLLSLFYNFILTPVLSYFLVQGMSGSPELALGFYLVMLIPGSSMAVAYTGMAGGSMEVATIAQAAGFLVAPLVLPFFLHQIGQSYAIAVPLGTLVTSIVTVLILPMIAGDLTRRWIVRHRGPKAVQRAKPMLGLVTLSTMLLLIGLIFFSKGALLAENWRSLLPLIAATIVFMVVILALMTWLDRRLGLTYAEHMAVAFVSSGKNNATAIGIAVSVTAFSPLVAIPAATLPLFQIVFLIGYLRLADWLRRYFDSPQCPESSPSSRLAACRT
jgi:ACR3 family arsenite efflux pump ArsB